LLRATPDLAGFFAANDIMALGLVAAARTEGRQRVAIVGVDGILDALRAVADGTMSATVSQYPYVIGHMGLQACVAAARGHALPRHVDAPLAVITRANAALAIQRFPQPTGAYGNPFDDLVRTGVTR
jgi:ribose transport system substrate-binding protein